MTRVGPILFTAPSQQKIGNSTQGNIGLRRRNNEQRRQLHRVQLPLSLDSTPLNASTCLGLWKSRLGIHWIVDTFNEPRRVATHLFVNC